MKKNIITRILCILMLGVLIAFIPLRYVEAKTTYDFEVSLNAGYGQKVLVGYGAPFEITVTNKNTSNFEGCLQLIIPGFEKGETITAYIKPDFKDVDFTEDSEYDCIINYVPEDEIGYEIELKTPSGTEDY